VQPNHLGLITDFSKGDEVPGTNFGVLGRAISLISLAAMKNPKQITRV
jgi:hypothetical protein